MDTRIANHELARRASVHESGHACARELFPSLNGVEFIALTFSSHDGALVGNVRCNPGTNESLFSNIVAELAGVAAEVLIAGADKCDALANASDDRAEVSKLVAGFDEADRAYILTRGMLAAYAFVDDNRETILRLADELIANQYIDGATVRAIVEGRRTENGNQETRT